MKTSFTARLLITALSVAALSSAARADGLNATIKSLGDQRDRLSIRLDATEKRLRAQYSALDSLIASMNTTSSYLTQQLASLASSS